MEVALPPNPTQLRSSAALSLVVHALFCALCLFLVRERALHPPSRTLLIDLEPPQTAEQKAADKRKEDLQHRIVQSNVGHEVKTAAPNAFLGEKTRVVDRETVNSHKVIQMGRTGQPAKIVAETPPKPRTQNKAQPKGETQAETKPKIELAKFGLAILPDARRKGAAEELSKDQPEWVNIGAEPQDYVDGIKESDRTALNTSEYLYYGYHQRIRQRLELEWTRLLREVLVRFYRNGRQLASDTEYTTKLLVILNARGEITKIKMLDASGTQELDDVAVQAFNKAGPFPNPPKGIVKNGEIEVPWELKLRS